MMMTREMTINQTEVFLKMLDISSAVGGHARGEAYGAPGTDIPVIDGVLIKCVSTRRENPKYRVTIE